MVPEGGRHATSDVSTLGKAALRAISLVGGAGGDRAPSCTGAFHAGDRTPARPGGIDDLPGVAPQRCHPKWRSGVSCDDGAVARRAIRSSPQTGEARAQRDIAHLCGGTTGWLRRSSERSCCSRPGRVLERTSAWTAAGPAMGQGLEPGADRSPLAGRLSGRWDDAHQPRSHLSGAVRPNSRCATPRVDRLLADRAAVTDAEGAHAQTGQGLHLARDHDLPTSG